jgi:hypothetical protein
MAGCAEREEMMGPLTEARKTLDEDYVLIIKDMSS